jgi:hypothetical protein
MVQCWHRLHQTKTHRLGGMNFGGRIQLVALLRNCHNSFNGGQTSAYLREVRGEAAMLAAMLRSTSPRSMCVHAD